MSATPTEGPWFVEQNRETGAVHICSKSTVCSETTVVNMHESQDDDENEAILVKAAFIVRACNSHLGLVFAAKCGLNFIENSESELGITLESGDLLRAALKNAGEKT